MRWCRRFVRSEPIAPELQAALAEAREARKVMHEAAEALHRTLEEVGHDG